MKTKLLLIFILTSPLIGFSQFKHSIDLVGGIDYSDRYLRNTEGSSLAPSINVFNEIGEGKLNWRLGVNYNYRISSKVFLKTGLRLISIGYQGKERTLRWGTEIGLPEEDLSTKSRWTLDQRFLEVPIVARLEGNQKKWTPFFELGLLPSFYLSTREKTVLTTENNTQTSIQNRNDIIENLNEFHLVSFVSFGINYNVSDHFQLFGQPAFRYHFTSLVDSAIGTHLLSYGLEIGLRRKIK